MTDNTYPPVQLSVMAGQNQIVFRAEDAEQLHTLVEGASAKLDEITERALEYQQLLMGKSVVATGVVGTPDSAPAQAFTPSAGPPTSAGVMCPHGAKEYREGTSKAGKPYKAHFCPSNVDGCTPTWVK